MLNKVLLIGNLTADPRELRTLPSGAVVGEFRIAVNDRFGGRDRENERTLFIDVVVWNKTAENCHRYLSKGRPVLVEGRLEEDSWTDKESGQPRSKMRVVASNVTFMPDRKGEGGGSYGDDERGSGGSSERSERSERSDRSDRSDRGGSDRSDRGSQSGGGGGVRGASRDSGSGSGGGSPLKDYGLDEDVPF